jgi:hypothetical protein
MLPGQPANLAGVKNTSGHHSCLHSINTISLLHPMDSNLHGNGESSEQVRKIYQGLLV